MRRNPSAARDALSGRPPARPVTVKSAGDRVISARDKSRRRLPRPPSRNNTTTALTEPPPFYSVILYGDGPVHGRQRACPRGPPRGAPGQEGRAAAKYSAELRVEAAGVEGRAFLLPDSIIYVRPAYIGIVIGPPPPSATWASWLTGL